MTAWFLAWLWQGVALAVGLSIALHHMPRVNAATRYLIWWGALAALVWLGWQASPNTSLHAVAFSMPALAPPAPLGVEVRPLPAWAVTLIVMLWSSVALFRLLRILPGVHVLYQMKDRCRPFPRAIEAQLPLWLECRGRRARLMVCDALPGAALLGLYDPCIALPSSMLRDLSPADLDQVILHEYGHVERRDDWMRLVQSLFESAFWMHPAAFLIGRELNLEREVACDDWVVARTASPRSYARCLSRVAELQKGRASSPVLGPALFGGHRELFRRVDRLLDASRNAGRTPSLAAVAMCLLLVAGFAVQARAFPLVIEALTPIVSTAESFAVREVTGDVVSGFGRIHQAGAPTDSPIRRKPGAADVPDATDAMVRWAPVATDAMAQSTPGTGFADAPSVVAPPAEVPTLEGVRAFHAIYVPVESRTLPGPPDSPQAPWQVAATAGEGLGAAARKAGVGLADTFSRTGVSIAKRFQ